MGNVQKFREPILAPDFLRIDGTPVGGATGVESSSEATASVNASVTDAQMPIREIVFTMTNLGIQVAGANDIGSALLGTVGVRHWMLLSCTCDLTIDRNGVVTNATDIYLGVGTAANASFPISAPAENLFPQILFGAEEQVTTVELISPVSTGVTGLLASSPKYLDKGDIDIYISTAGNNTGADGDFIFNGTVTLRIIDLGILGDV